MIIQKNICCDLSSEPSRRDGSDERSQHMVSLRNRKIILNNQISLLSRAPIYVPFLFFASPGNKGKSKCARILSPQIIDCQYIYIRTE